MTGDSPSWVYLDLQAGPVPPALQLPSEDGEEGPTTVMIMATGAAREEGWAARAALHLVREWTRAGSRIFLMDLNLDAPDLHGFLGHENREGVSDVLLYGASVPRVSRPVDGGSFYLATAGTAVADATEVLSHSRWTEVIEGFREAGVTLVLYCPHELLNSSPLTRASKVRVLLRGPWEEKVEVDPESPTPTAVAGPGLGASGQSKWKVADGTTPDARGEEEEYEPSSLRELDPDEFAPVAQDEVGFQETGSPFHQEQFRSFDFGVPESLKELVAPEETSRPEGGSGPLQPETSHEADGVEADTGALETVPGLNGEVASPTEHAPAEPARSESAPAEPAPAEPAPISGKPREVAGSEGGRALRTILLVILALLVGVLLADFLGYLDLSSVVDLPWHEAVTATAHLLGLSRE